MPTAILVDDVWGEAAPANAAKSLSTQVTDLRRALRPLGATIDHTGTGYVLELGPLSLDVERFRARAAEGGVHLATALRLWRGEALAGLDGPFAATARAELEREHAATEDALVRHLLATDPGRAITLLQRLVERTPHREDRWTALVDALVVAGRAADALDAFQGARRVLADDLGLDPGPELQRAERRALGVDRPAAVAAPAPSMLRGRAPELAALRAAVDRRHDGVRVAYVVGEPGIGKTAVLEELTASLRADGVTVLGGRCARDAAVPLDPVLAAIARHPGGEALLDAALGPLLRGGPASLPDSLQLHRRAVLDAVLSVLEAVAGDDGLAFLTDDLQWSDLLSAAFVLRLVTDRAALPVVLVGALRAPDDRLPAVAGRIADMARLVPVSRIELGPLDRASVRAIATGILGPGTDPDVLDRIEGAAGGNPLFVEQLAGLVAHGADPWGDDLPAELLALCRARLHLADDDCVELLQAAAVLEEGFTVAEVAVLTEASELTAARLVDEAVHLGLVVPTGDPDHHEFAHGLVRRALLNDLGASRAARLHLAAAGLARSRANAGRLADHLLAAAPLAPPDEVAAALVAAGEEALLVGALELALARFQQALAVGPDGPAAPRAELGAGTALLASGAPGAGERLERAVEAARRRDDWATVADATLARSHFGLLPSIPMALEAAAEAEAVLANLDPGDVLRRARLRCWVAEVLVNVDTARAADALERAAADGAGDPELDGLVAYVGLRIGDAWGDDPDALADQAAAVVAAARDAGDATAVARAATQLQGARLRAGAFATARAEQPALAAEARLSRRRELVDQVDLFEVALAMVDGDVAAIDECSAANTRDEQGRHPALAVARMLHLVVVRREQRRLGELVDVLRLSLLTSPRRYARPVVAAGLLERGELDAGTDELLTFAAELPAIAVDWAHDGTMAVAVDALADLDDAGAAGAVAGLAEALEARLLPTAGRVVVTSSCSQVLGRADRYLGRTARLRGDLDLAVERFATARRLDQRAGARLWAAWAGADEADARLRRGRRQDRATADRLLAAAGAEAAALGSTRLALAVERSRRR